MTFWFVYDAKSWSPQDGEVADILPPGVSFNRIASFEDNAGHPLFALLYHTDGLRAFNMGLIEAEADDLPAALLADEAGRFSHIFGPFTTAHIQESLVRLHGFTLTKSTIEDTLSMISALQAVRQRLSALGRLEEWNERMETMGVSLGALVEELQYSPSQTPEHLFAPLNPASPKK